MEQQENQHEYHTDTEDPQKYKQKRFSTVHRNFENSEDFKDFKISQLSLQRNTKISFKETG